MPISSVRQEEPVDGALTSSDDVLLSGLSADDVESARLAQAFWETAWPKLELGGWEKRVR
jgi:hypothetical protein